MGACGVGSESLDKDASIHFTPAQRAPSNNRLGTGTDKGNLTV